MGIARKAIAALSVLFRVSFSYILGDKLLNKAYYVPGDLNVGGIFPVTTYNETAICGVSDSDRALKTMEILATLTFAVEKINEDPTLLPGIKLGYVFLDSCSNHQAAVLQAIRFLPRMNEREYRPSSEANHLLSYNVIGVIGTSISQITIPVSILLGGAGMPLVSFADGSDELSNKKIHPTFLRLISPDVHHIMAILSFMKHNGWMYFSVLVQDNESGRMNLNELARISAEFGMCRSVVMRVSDDADFKEVAFNLMTSSARVVVSLISQSSVGLLAKALRDLRALGNLIWIGSERFLEFLPFNDVLEGTFVVSSYPLELEGFREYMSKVDLKRNPWMVPELLGRFYCHDPQCSKFLLRLNPGKFTLTTPGIYDSMMTYAHGLQNLFDDLCPKTKNVSAKAVKCYYQNHGKLIRYLKNVSFVGASGKVNFNEKGDRLAILNVYQSVRRRKNETPEPHDRNSTILVKRVAYYDISERKLVSYNNLTLHWVRFRLNETLIQTRCKIPCLPNEYKNFVKGCCWLCRKCQSNEKVADNGTACHACPPFHWPALVNDKLSTCELIEATVFNWLHPATVAILVANGVGVLMIFFVLATLWLNQESDEEEGPSILVVIQLTAVAWGLMAVPIYLLRPTIFNCNTAHALFLLSFSVLYLALLLRTVEVYRKCLKAIEDYELKYSNNKYLVIFTVTVVVVKILIYSGLLAQYPVRALSIQPTASEKLVELVCDIPFPHTIAFLMFSMILLLICSIISLKSQNDPYGFDQNRFVSMFVVTSLIMWIAFMPAYFTATSHRMRTYFRILAILVNHISALMLNFTSAFLELCIRRRKDSGTVGFGFFRSSRQSGNTTIPSLRIAQTGKRKLSQVKSSEKSDDPQKSTVITQNVNQ